MAVAFFMVDTPQYFRDNKLNFTHYYADENLQPLVGEISWNKHLIFYQNLKAAKNFKFIVWELKKIGWTKDVLIYFLKLKHIKQFS